MLAVPRQHHVRGRAHSCRRHNGRVKRLMLLHLIFDMILWELTRREEPPKDSAASGCQCLAS
jgi:hypothetical protein